MRLRHKVVVVTGGASGIGLAICKRVVQEGGLAIVADIDEAAARKTASDLGEGHAHAVRIDAFSNAGF
jgi:NAD(P)-dependent dehydrogenase (short-subunit alcohol dehydrogenase family)